MPKITSMLCLLLAVIPGVARAAESVYVACEGQSVIPVYSSPGSLTASGNLACGQEVTITGKEGGYARITLAGTQPVYALSHFIRSAANTTPAVQAETVSASNQPVTDRKGVEAVKKSTGGFWKKLAAGVAVGALVTASAYAAANSDYDSSGVYARSAQPVNPPGGADNSIQTTHYNSTASAGYHSRGNAQQIGQFTHYRFSNGDGVTARGTSQRLGDFTYYNFSNSNGVTSRGTSQQIGDFNYSRFSDSNGTTSRGTSQTIGDFKYFRSTDSNGNQVRGTSQRIGNAIYSRSTDSNGNTTRTTVTSY